MERVTSLRHLVPLALLWLHCRPAGNARQSTGLSDSIVRASSPAKKPSRLAGLFSGAGDEARTRYLHLGKVALYRMSYTRIGIGCQPSEPNLFDSSDSDLHGADRRNRISSIPTILTNMVPPVGIEPTTRGFSVRCSTY